MHTAEHILLRNRSVIQGQVAEVMSKKIGQLFADSGHASDSWELQSLEVSPESMGIAIKIVIELKTDPDLFSSVIKELKSGFSAEVEVSENRKFLTTSFSLSAE